MNPLVKELFINMLTPRLKAVAEHYGIDLKGPQGELLMMFSLTIIESTVLLMPGVIAEAEKSQEIAEWWRAVVAWGLATHDAGKQAFDDQQKGT